MRYLENCVTSLKRNCIKAEMKHYTGTCCGTSCSVAPELTNSVRAWSMSRLQGNKIYYLAVLQNSMDSCTPKKKRKKKKTNTDLSFTSMLSPQPPLNPSVNRGKQFITSDMVLPKSHYFLLSAARVVTTNTITRQLCKTPDYLHPLSMQML